MERPQKQKPEPALIEAYRQQMLALQRQQSPAPPPAEATTDAEIGESWLDRHFPLPDVERDRAAMTVAPAEPAVAQPPAESPPESPYVGYLQVFVFTGKEAEPLPGARVVITRPQEGRDIPYANLQTDRDRLTPIVPLPTVDPALTLRPGTEQPYVPYTIRVSREGFSTAEHQNVPVYGNNYVTQPAPLYPLLPGEGADTVRYYVSGGPVNL